MSTKSTPSILSWIDRLSARKGSLLFFLVAVSILLRLGSFFYSVIDHDVSSYMIMSKELVNGATLYNEVVDIKPPGIFGIFYTIQLLFGESIFVVRLIGAICLGLTAYLLFLVRLNFDPKPRLAFFSAFAYLIIFSIYRTGMAVNTELFFSLTTISCLFFLSRKTHSAGQEVKFWLFAGLIMGYGLSIKYTVAVDFTAFLLFFFYRSIKNGRWKRQLGLSFVAGLASTIPFIIIHLYYWSIGQFEAYTYVTYIMPQNYASTLSLSSALEVILNFHLRYIPFVIAFYWALTLKGKGNDVLRFFALLWFLLVWLAVIVPGKVFDHYLLHLCLPLSFLIPEMLKSKVFQGDFWQRKLQPIVLGAIGVCSLIILINQSYYWTTADVQRQIAKDLEAEVKATDLILTGPKYQIVYYLLGLKPPSKYVHPTIIYNHSKAFGINATAEMQATLDKKPAYIIYKRSFPMKEFEGVIENNYFVYKTYGKVQLLKLRH